MSSSLEKYPSLEWLDAGRAHGKKVNNLRSWVRKFRYSNDIDIHPHSWANLDEPDKPRPYRKTFKFRGRFIDERHWVIATASGGRNGVAICIDLGIDGWLQYEDALKIYELARLTKGDVLELGTHYGLSTSIIASALDKRGSGAVETIDVIRATTEQAKLNLADRPGAERVTFMWMEADKRMRELIAEGRRYSFIFIDHWHGYDSTVQAAQLLSQLLEPGGFVQFHDFADAENANPDHPHAVFQAVLDTVAKDGRFLFCGNYGCTGVFRYLR